MSNKQGRLVIISGPSGVGKTTIVKRLLDLPNVIKSISATTRPPRAGEGNGRDYFFYTREHFLEGIPRGEFLEYAEILGYYYGTPRAPVEHALSEGKTVILEIDVQGNDSVRRLGFSPPPFSIFILPPTTQELEKRLVGREGKENTEIQRRLKHAEQELRLKDNYDFCIINDVLEQTVERVRETFVAKGIL